MKKRQFYKVKPEYDGKLMMYETERHNNAYYLLAGELLTDYLVKQYNIPKQWLEVVYLNKEEWVYSFGARFAIDDLGKNRLA